MTTNPFAISSSSPGHGTITLSLLPPSTPVLRALSFQYPLKLIAPSALRLPITEHEKPSEKSYLIHTVFLLTYGGGLVAGDSISLTVTLAPTTRLILVTQGSTKIFKSPSSDIVTSQHMSVHIEDGAALCYLPDPVQPFEASAFEQKQTYNMGGGGGSLCVCDWVSEGRTSRGERWAFRKYISRNEIWLTPAGSAKRRLLLRDNLILDASAAHSESVMTRMDELGVFGTLILCGPMFQELGSYFMDEFKLLPRIGSRQWDAPTELSPEEVERAARVEKEKSDGLLWSAATLRGSTVVKFGAREIEGARRWLRCMLRTEGTIERKFGERALLCLR